MRSRLLLLLAALFCVAGDAPPEQSEDLVTKALQRIDQLYLHPGAIDPPAMLAAGVQRLERESPDLLVLEEPDGRLLVRSGQVQKPFDVADVQTVAEARARLGQVVAFAMEGRDGSEEFDADDLEIAALRGMLHTIDRHSRLIVGDGLDEFNTRFKGTLVGIGSRIGRREDDAGELQLQILGPFPDSPAERAGLQVGDVITHIDGHATIGISVDDAVERIRGPEHVPVVLTVRRPGEDGRRVYVIVREKVIVPSVEHELLPGDVGYIIIDHFSQKTSKEVASSLDELQAGAEELRGVVIDLRGNTGGSMRHATRIVNYFVDTGELLRTEGADGGKVEKLTHRMDADARFLRYEGPVAVLVDSRTASGSEIVAGGLKYTGRSVTIGSQTFGKGTVQKVYPLRRTEGDEVSMKLTVARYLLPGESFINKVGVTPDIATGPIWLDPDEPLLPERLREPAKNTGHVTGAGGLDARRNPGGGSRAPTTGGVNASPELWLFYPRVIESWTEGEEPRAEDPRHVGVPTEERAGWSDLVGDAGEAQFNDVELALAWELLRQAAPGDRREELLEAAKPLVEDLQQQHADRMAAATRRKDIPWAAEPIPRWMDRSPLREDDVQTRLAGPPPEGITATLHLPDRFEAGEESAIRLEVRNDRDEPLRHLRARVESSSDILDGASFLVGDLDPRDARGWTVPVLVDPATPTRLDDWRLYLIDDTGPLGGPFTGLSESRGAERPLLALKVGTRTEAQEDGSLVVIATALIRNDGGGATGEVQVHFGEPKADGVERLERFRALESIEPGAQAQAELRLRVRDPAALPMVPIRLRARDKRSQTSTYVSLEIPTGGDGLSTDWLEPPRLEMKSPHSERTAPPARAGTDFRVRGKVKSDAGLRSVWVSVAGDQVYSQLLPATPKSQPIDVPAVLELGPNRVRVVAETAEGVEISRVYWVLGEK